MDDRVIVQRANVVLRISPQQVDYYLSQGYNVIDENGNIVKASVPKDLGTLQKAFVEHTAQIDALKEEIAKLKKRNSKAKDTKE